MRRNPLPSIVRRSSCGFSARIQRRRRRHRTELGARPLARPDSWRSEELLREAFGRPHPFGRAAHLYSVVPRIVLATAYFPSLAHSSFFCCRIFCCTRCCASVCLAGLVWARANPHQPTRTISPTERVTVVKPFVAICS